MKCNVCGAEFEPLREMRYTGRDDRSSGLTISFGLNSEEKLYDCFDCPVCGCQNAVNERKREYEVKNIVEGKGGSSDENNN